MKIKVSTKDRLDQLGQKGETYDDIIKGLLDNKYMPALGSPGNPIKWSVGNGTSGKCAGCGHVWENNEEITRLRGDHIGTLYYCQKTECQAIAQLKAKGE